MYRTLTVLRLQKWAYDIAPNLTMKNVEEVNRISEQLTGVVKAVLSQTLKDNKLDHSNIYDNINVSFNKDWGIRVEVDDDEIPYFKHLDQGYGPFDIKRGALNSGKAKYSKQGNRYINIPLKIDSTTKFRTISDKSNPFSWIHPGYKASHVLDKTIDRSSRIIKRELIYSFSEMLGT